MSSRIDNYNDLKRIVGYEIERLGEGCISYKDQRIKDAMERIAHIILRDNRAPTVLPQAKLYLGGVEVTHLDINTIEDMLDVRMDVFESGHDAWNEQGMEFSAKREGFYRRQTLRAALNIATNNFFNWFGGGNFGPIWGKSQALINVETHIKYAGNQ